MKMSNFFNTTVLGLFAVTTLSVNAHDFSVGTKYQNEETPRLSIRTEASLRRVRFVPYSDEIICSEYRKDLCDHTEDTVMIEIEAPLGRCDIADDVIASCNYNTFQATKTYAVLKNGSKIELNELDVTISAGTLKVLQLNEHNKFVPVTRTTLDVQIWGYRADGLDPIVQSIRPSRFSYEDYTVVNKSLFD